MYRTKHLPAFQPLAVIQPTNLNEVAQRAVDDLLREGESKNTLLSYRSALRYWAAWYSLRYGAQLQLPLPCPSVLQFIVDHAERTTDTGLISELPPLIDQQLVLAGYKGRVGALAHNTLVHRIAVLSKLHQLRGLKNPCHDPRVRELLSRTRKAYAKRGVLPKKKDALTKDLLQALLATCDDSLRGKRDRALLLFAWASGGRRRSEVSGAEMRFLKPIGSEFIYNLAYSKTNQTALDIPENIKPLLGMAAIALREWLDVSGIVEGRVFRRVLKGGHLGGPLSAAGVNAVVKERCVLAGVNGQFSAHSLRSGFVTEASRQDIGLAETMAMSGHRSVTTVLGYIRNEQSLSSRAARLIE
jgi:integrase